MTLSESQFRVLELIHEIEGVKTEASANERAEEVCQILARLQDEAWAIEATLETRTGADRETESVKCRNQLEFVYICYRRLRNAQRIGSDTRQRAWQALLARQLATQPSKDTYIPEERTEPKKIEEGEKDVHVSKSEDITSTLRRIHQMAQGEVLRSELNIGELDMSSRTLRQLQEKYSAADVLLNGSRKLIKFLDEADSWDRKCMLASLSFLGAVIAWILWRRILSGPVRLLLWSVLRVLGVVRWASKGIGSQGTQNNIDTAGIYATPSVASNTGSIWDSSLHTPGWIPEPERTPWYEDKVDASRFEADSDSNSESLHYEL